MHPIRSILALLSLLGFAVAFAAAEMPGRTSGNGFGPKPGYSEALNLDPSRAAQVEAILRQRDARVRTAHEQIGRPSDEATRATLHAALEAIRGDTDAKLAAILSPEELQKLRVLVPPPATPRLEAMTFKRG
jgi:hypothetical protein